MAITLVLLMKKLSGEPVPWWAFLITAGFAVLLHGKILLGISRSH